MNRIFSYSYIRRYEWHKNRHIIVSVCRSGDHNHISHITNTNSHVFSIWTVPRATYLIIHVNLWRECRTWQCRFNALNCVFRCAAPPASPAPPPESSSALQTFPTPLAMTCFNNHTQMHGEVNSKQQKKMRRNSSVFSNVNILLN